MALGYIRIVEILTKKSVSCVTALNFFSCATTSYRACISYFARCGRETQCDCDHGG